MDVAEAQRADKFVPLQRVGLVLYVRDINACVLVAGHQVLDGSGWPPAGSNGAATRKGRSTSGRPIVNGESVSLIGRKGV